MNNQGMPLPTNIPVGQMVTLGGGASGNYQVLSAGGGMPLQQGHVFTTSQAPLMTNWQQMPQFGQGSGWQNISHPMQGGASVGYPFQGHHLQMMNTMPHVTVSQTNVHQNVYSSMPGGHMSSYMGIPGNVHHQGPNIPLSQQQQHAGNNPKVEVSYCQNVPIDIIGQQRDASQGGQSNSSDGPVHPVVQVGSVQMTDVSPNTTVSEVKDSTTTGDVLLVSKQSQVEHSCTQCPKVFAQKEALTAHVMKEHSQGSSFPCPVCHLSHKDQRSQKEHLDTHRMLVCALCPETPKFYTLHQCARHMLEHQMEPDIKLVVFDKCFNDPMVFSEYMDKQGIGNCLVCGERFVDPADRMDHLRDYHNVTQPAFINEKQQERVKGFKCPVCTEECKKYSSVVSHLTQHMDPSHKLWRCEVCKKQFKSINLLKSHSEAEHTNPGIYRCSACRETYSSPFALETHIKSGHKSEAQFECVACSACFDRMWDVIKHITNEHKQRSTAPRPLTQSEIIRKRFKRNRPTLAEAYNSRPPPKKVPALEGKNITALSLEDPNLEMLISDIVSDTIGHPTNSSTTDSTASNQNEGQGTTAVEKPQVVEIKDDAFSSLVNQALAGPGVKLTEEQELPQPQQDPIIMALQSAGHTLQSISDTKDENHGLWIRSFPGTWVLKHIQRLGITSETPWREIATYLESQVTMLGDIKPYFCSICLMAFELHDEIDAHIFNHCMLDTAPYLCFDCMSPYSNRASITQHMKNRHLDGGLYSCAECGMRALSLHKLNTHIKATHSNSSDYKCTLCQKHFNNGEAINEHLAVHNKLRKQEQSAQGVAGQLSSAAWRQVTVPQQFTGYLNATPVSLQSSQAGQAQYIVKLEPSE